MKISERDAEYISAYGLTPKEVERQMSILEKGLAATEVVAAATPDKGIVLLSDADKLKYLQKFNNAKDAYNIEKFVPASGAATRMFKEMVFFHNNYQVGKDYYERFVKKHRLTSFEEEMDDFFNVLSSFPFYTDLMEVVRTNEPELFQLDENEQVWKYVHYVLSDDGLGYEKLPKALLKFHRYPDGIKTALEEHLVEVEAYAKGKNRKAKLHFSISPRHEQAFKALVDELSDKYDVEVSYSFQKPETDTVMLDMETQTMLRDENDKPVFRPGGHGSLIDNIQDLNADIVFVKNIDNVQKDKTNTLEYKKILGGILMDLIEKNQKYLSKLRDDKPIGEDLQEIENFAGDEMNINFIEGFDMLNNGGKRKYLAYKLNRPIRVAGMVRNTGEPGGGPFWAKDKNGLKSLQIVEKSQMDLNCSDQKNIFEQATHFNPVDLVLSIKDFEGNSFDLKKFVNEEAAFLSEKSYAGKAVKVYERPGLWNGAMDDWNTVFVEVPSSTFSPVKTLNDLLRPEHQ